MPLAATRVEARCKTRPGRRADRPSKIVSKCCLGRQDCFAIASTCLDLVGEGSSFHSSCIGWTCTNMSYFRLLSDKRAFAALIFLIAMAGALWWRFGRGPEVAAVAPTRGTAVEIVYGTGAVEPVRWAKVASLLRQRIVDLCYCEGKQVAKGDVLARLDDKEARAQLSELKAREDFAKREFTRVTELIGRGVASAQAFERISSDLRQIQGLISVQMEKLDAYTITAPIEGVVLRRDGEIGEIVEQGQILFRVGAPTPLHVVAEVNEEDIPRVAVDQTSLLRTDAFPGRRLEGKVYEITPMGDAVARPIESASRCPTTRHCTL